MKGLLTVILGVCFFMAQGQSSVKGKLLDNESSPVAFSNVALYRVADSNMVKVGTTDINGDFNIKNLSADNYFLKATFVGLPDLVLPQFELGANETRDLETLSFASKAAELKEFSIAEERSDGG